MYSNGCSMNLELIAQKISDSYVKKNEDMNTSIAKIASEQNLNIEQTKRLVEECNKGCYLQKMAETGEQIFDIADYEKVKALVTNPQIEKKATVTFTDTKYDIFESFEKTADTQVTHAHLSQAIERCKDEAGKHLSKYSDLCKVAEYKCPGITENLSSAKGTSLEKLANEIISELKEVKKFQTMKDNLLEKRAGIASAIAGAGLRTGGAVIGTAIKHPNKAVFVPLQVVSSAKMGAKKTQAEPQPFLANNSELGKVAGIGSELLEEGLKFGKKAIPAAAILGMIGIGSAAARGMGGMVSQMMNKRQLDESFETVFQDNKDIQGIPNARGYFDVIARHSPSLAMDPMVAPQLIRQFDSFGGVDVNTVGKLREIENTGKSKEGSKPFDLLGGISSVQSLRSGFDNDERNAANDARNAAKERTERIMQSSKTGENASLVNIAYKKRKPTNWVRNPNGQGFIPAPTSPDFSI